MRRDARGEEKHGDYSEINKLFSKSDFIDHFAKEKQNSFPSNLAKTLPSSPTWPWKDKRTNRISFPKLIIFPYLSTKNQAFDNKLFSKSDFIDNFAKEKQNSCAPI